MLKRHCSEGPRAWPCIGHRICWGRPCWLPNITEIAPPNRTRWIPPCLQWGSPWHLWKKGAKATTTFASPNITPALKYIQQKKLALFYNTIELINVVCAVIKHIFRLFRHVTRPVTSLGHLSGAKSFLRGAQIFQTMSNSFKPDMCNLQPAALLVQPAWFCSWSWNGISNELHSSIFRATNFTIIYHRLLHLTRGLQSLKFTNK